MNIPTRINMLFGIWPQPGNRPGVEFDVHVNVVADPSPVISNPCITVKSPTHLSFCFVPMRRRPLLGTDLYTHISLFSCL